MTARNEDDWLEGDAAESLDPRAAAQADLDDWLEDERGPSARAERLNVERVENASTDRVGAFEIGDPYEGLDPEAPRLTQMRQARLRKVRFLKAFAERGVMADGCRVAGVSRWLVAQHWRVKDPWFEERYREAEEHAADALEAEAVRRAMQGVDEPVIFQGMPTFVEDPTAPGGKRIFTVKKYSDGLLQTLLKARRRDKFGDQVKQSVNMEGSVGVLVVPGQLTGDDWEKAAAAHQERYTHAKED